jgi:hypothetical protein
VDLPLDNIAVIVEHPIRVPGQPDRVPQTDRRAYTMIGVSPCRSIVDTSWTVS